MGTTVLDPVVLRPVTDTDDAFLLALYGEIRAAELDQVAWEPGQREAFLRMQLDLQTSQYRAAHPQGSFDLVEVEGRPAGRLYVSRRPDDIRIVDVALTAEFRGRGIGGALVSRVIDEATASGRSTSIHVEVHNPAARLYQRLGFRPVARRGVYVLMERSPS
ncbi:GNAT family N-acetyltransferase [Nocardioides humi]|uniref:N-acetyltransferase domain-containing protein n=1 Tax=Nocardioides humi TaxID=449461 RepID=A0ABN2BMF5_9ACTN|nr:GNAT family N-acetyltransferase [Nocardioides humi]